MTDETRPQDSAAMPAGLPSHAELIRLIGEIDGIDLEGHGGRLFVNLRIGGKSIQLISDSGESPSHHITREGIRSVLSQANTAAAAKARAAADGADGAVAADEITRLRDEIARLRLTEAEREALERAAQWMVQLAKDRGEIHSAGYFVDDAATLRGILARRGGDA